MKSSHIYSRILCLKFILGSRVPKSMPNVMNIDVLADVEVEIFCFHLAKVKKVFVMS